MKRRLERLGVVEIVYKTNGFGFNFVTKTENRFGSTADANDWLLAQTNDAFNRLQGEDAVLEILDIAA